MKELSIEEKAKAYDEAIKRAKSLYDNNQPISGSNVIINDIFPELKKSEDERIRKMLIKFFGNGAFCDSYTNGISDRDIVAWLEKQSSNPYTGVSFEYNGNTWGMCARDNGVDILLNREFIQHVSTEKQGKKEIDDKVKPKFKVGDWVVSGQFVTQIRKIVGDGYVNSHDGFISFEVEKYYHLWTIADAKNGDVLTCNINKAEIGGDIEKLPNITPTICIYQNVVKDKDYIHTYCSLYNESSLVLSNSMYYNMFVYNIQPATKEQRDLLFKKMEEAGYKFDFEKKELKRIEQKPATMSLDAYKLFAISAVEDYYDEKNPLRKCLVDWLKSLRPQNTWKPSDEQMNDLKIAIDSFTFEKDYLQELYEDLKKLREK